MTLSPPSEPAQRTTSYMGDSDSEVWKWSANFADTMDANFAAYGLTAGDAANIRAVTDAFAGALQLARQPSTNSRSAILAKNEARDELEQVCRSFAMQIKANPNVSDVLKVDAGIHVDDPHRTRIGRPRSVPVLTMLGMDWTSFRLRFRDMNLPGSRRKPAGVTHLMLFAEFALPGEFTDDFDNAHFIKAMSRSPQRIRIPRQQREGLAAQYYGCWMNAKGDLGPMSAPLRMPGFGVETPSMKLRQAA